MNYMEEIRRRIRRDQAARDAEIPAPPAHVLNREITIEDVRAYPRYFILTTQGSERARKVMCEHGYGALDSCPNCP